MHVSAAYPTVTIPSCSEAFLDQNLDTLMYMVLQHQGTHWEHSALEGVHQPTWNQ